VTKDQMRTYLSSLIQGRDEPSLGDGKTIPLDIEDTETAKEKARIVQELQDEVRTVVNQPGDEPRSVDNGLAGVANKAFDLLSGPDFEEVVDFALKARRSDPTRAHREGHLLEDYSDLLDPNPRAAKRFLMAYSVNFASRLAEGGDFDSQTLALWTLLAIRWPALADWVREQLPESSLEPVDQDGHPSQLLFDPDVNRVIQCGNGGPLDRNKVLRCCGYRLVV
jgi:hypothetical protein